MRQSAYIICPRAGRSSGHDPVQYLLAAVEYWSAYGLRPDVLREVCRAVFGLDVSR